MDPLRDEGTFSSLPLELHLTSALGLIYATMLETDSGVKTKVDVYPGLPHGHWGFFPFLKSSAKFRKEQITGFGWLLGKEPAVQRVQNQMNPTSV